MEESEFAAAVPVSREIRDSASPVINLEAMHNITPTLAVLILIFNHCVCLAGDEWMTWRSTYTHDAYGQRVDQYNLPVEPQSPRRADFQRSGFRHTRSTLQAGNSADNYHLVEQWGAPIVPYEQWRFPFRPFGVPYDAWGPQAPYGIINSNIGIGLPAYPPNYGPGYPQPTVPPTMPPTMPPNTGMHPGLGYPPPGAAWGEGFRPGAMPPPTNGFPLTPTYQNQPWFDGQYPEAAPLGQGR